jgi:tetratricopeptide (TPR) repeat protein
MVKKIPERRTVMISSTARDLPEHREQVRLACERAGFAPHDMMENLTALKDDAIKASLDMVERADVYVGIFANRYGYVPDGHDISVTEMEYDRASELGKPRLIFFSHEDHLFKPKDIEKGPGAEKLERLKDRLSKKHVAAFFKSAEDLRAHVGEALAKLREEIDPEGPYSTVAKSEAAFHRISVIPARSLEPYIAHPYTLLQSRELVGRQKELNALTDWVTKPDATNDARVFCLVAIGGMGKSALAWKWFNEIAPKEMNLAGRMWWSFYESDGTFENFLIRALCYVSGRSEDEARQLSWPIREALVLAELNDRPYLFVLDGLERILLAYNRMDASRLADDDLDRQTVNMVSGAAGQPSAVANSSGSRNRLRETTDRRAGAFLQKLALITKSHILITTRLYPSELQSATGQSLHGCFAYFLSNLSDDDAIGLWRALGVSGARQELLPVFRSFENHPLLIQALASVVANYRAAPGDFTKWRSANPQFDPTSLPVPQSRTHILRYALNGLSEESRTVLSMIVGFRMPASYASLEALLVGPGKALASAQELDRTLTDLEDRGLIGWDRNANRYDAHPIVRGVVWQLTGAREQHAVYKALDAHFEPMGTPQSDEVESLSDLSPGIERYNTLIGLERYDDAVSLFRDRLIGPLMFRLGAYRESIALLERLFPKGIEALPALTHERDQSWALNSLGASYRFAGQPRLSSSVRRRAYEIDHQNNDETNQQVDLSNLGHTLNESGSMREAEWALRTAIVLSRKLANTFGEGMALRQFGRALAARNDSMAQFSLKRSRNIFIEFQGDGLDCANLAEHALWRGKNVRAATFADQAWELAGVRRFERDFIRAALMQGRAAIGLRQLGRADERLHQALTRARVVNLVEAELPALIACAELALIRMTLEQARTLLDEVWEIAQRGPYPMLQADANNLLTEIARAEGDKSAAIDAATKAYKTAWCDGPPYAYHWGLEKAKAHLKALGAPEPEMPPFDESKFEPLPDVEINPKDKYWVDPDKLDD